VLVKGLPLVGTGDVSVKVSAKVPTNDAPGLGAAIVEVVVKLPRFSAAREGLAGASTVSVAPVYVMLDVPKALVLVMVVPVPGAIHDVQLNRPDTVYVTSVACAGRPTAIAAANV